MPSSISNSNPPFEIFARSVPALPWGAVLASVLLITVIVVTAWELHCRSLGYTPGLDDTSDLWVAQRRQVQPDSLVIIGASRGLFDLDLNELEKGLKQRPIQLSLVGSNCAPILEHLAAEKSFHGTIICDIVPGLIMTPPQAPPYKNSLRALERLNTQSWAQRASHHIAQPLELSFAALQQEDLTLGALLKQIPLADRHGAQIPPSLPPYFYTIDHERRARMIPGLASNDALRERISHGWMPLFTPPPFPKWIDQDAAKQGLFKGFEKRFADLTQAVDTIRQRGGQVIFLRLPSSGPLRELEDTITPRAAVWDKLLAVTKAPGIHYLDHPDLADFTCPEWSHLSADDSIEFTKRLTPKLQLLLNK